jgi:uncharacterized protein (DUF2336 family)
MSALNGPARAKILDLIALAAEPSSARRRELLREITDLFFVTQGEQSKPEQSLFDEVLTRLSQEMEVEVQAELAQRLAASTEAPKNLARSLACAPIDVARPILKSNVLDESDLLHVVASTGQDHLRAVSGRTGLSSIVSDAIIDRADDETLHVLVRNETAELSREGSERVVTRATSNPMLQEAVVERKSLPVDLLNDMYFVVEARLREKIIERNSLIDPATLAAALETGRKRLASRDGALPPDYAEAEAHVKKLRRQNALGPTTLVAFLRAKETTRFLVALCELTEIDFGAARRIFERKDLDALAIVCKAADFDRALFLTFAILMSDGGAGMARATEYGQLYNDLPKDAAMRTIRFWRMRRTTGDVAAA